MVYNFIISLYKIVFAHRVVLHAFYLSGVFIVVFFLQKNLSVLPFQSLDQDQAWHFVGSDFPSTPVHLAS